MFEVVRSWLQRLGSRAEVAGWLTLPVVPPAGAFGPLDSGWLRRILGRVFWPKAPAARVAGRGPGVPWLVVAVPGG